MFIQQNFFSHRYDGNTHIYTFDSSKLSNHECHVIFPMTHCKEFLIVTALEFITFHPQTQINRQFNASLIHCGAITFHWFSFPKEFQETCRRAAKMYDMTMNIIPRTVGINTGSQENPQNTIVNFPAHRNLLFFQGENDVSRDSMMKESETIEEIGNTLERLGID